LLAGRDPGAAAARARRLARKRGAAPPAEVMLRARALVRAKRLVALVYRIDGMRRAGEDGAALACVAELRAAAACSDEEKMEALMIAVRGERADVSEAICRAGIGAPFLCRLFTHCSAGVAARIGMDPLETLRQALALAVTRERVRRLLRCRLGRACLARLLPHVKSGAVAAEAFAAAVSCGDAAAAALYYAHWPEEREAMTAVALSWSGATSPRQILLTRGRDLDWLIRNEMPLRSRDEKEAFMDAAFCGDIVRLRKIYDTFPRGTLLSVPMKCYHPEAFDLMVSWGYDWLNYKNIHTAIRVMLHRRQGAVDLCGRLLQQGMHVLAGSLIRRVPLDAVTRYVEKIAADEVAGRELLHIWSKNRSGELSQEHAYAVADGLSRRCLARARLRVLRPHAPTAHLAFILASKRRRIRLPPELHQLIAENFLA